jgi:hypothetical protein
LAPPLRRSSRLNFGVPRRDPSMIYTINLATLDSFFHDDPDSYAVYHNLWIFKASQSDPDVLTFDEAMRAPDRDKWIEAATKEIRELEAHDAWVEVPLSDAKKKVTPTSWVFRRKRAPDGTLLKWKGRFVCRGDLEEKEPHEETFSPVASWSSIRVIMTLALIWNWHSCTIDFSNAFIQAQLDSPKWIHLPRGFKSSLPGKTCLRLKRSLYGSSVAPRLFYQLQMTTLKDFSFQQSSVDPCLFFKPGFMIASWVDDLFVCLR